MPGEDAPSDPDRPQYHGIDVGYMLTAALCVVFLALLAFALHVYVRHLIARDRQRRTAVTIFRATVTAGESGAAALDPSALARLPTFVYRKGDSPWRRAGEGSAAECAICLSVAEEGEAMRLLPNCKHVFHVACIDKWFGFNSTCPVCRAGAVTAVGAGASQASGSLRPDQLRSENAAALGVHER